MVPQTLAFPSRMGELSPAKNQALDQILSTWHAWQITDKGVRGFNRRALVVGDCRPWRLQYDGQLDQLDADMDNVQSRQVNHEVSQMGEPHRTAIYMDARNLHHGISVWSSPRLPKNHEERAIVVKYARFFLVRRLESSGVM